jgi:hypothetical protein
MRTKGYLEPAGDVMREPPGKEKRKTKGYTQNP